MKREIIDYIRKRGLRDAFLLCFLGAVQLMRGATHGYWPVFIGKGVRIRGRSRVRLGRLVRIEDHVELDGYGSEGLTIGDRCKIGKFSIIKVAPSPHVEGAGIWIGAGTALAEFCFVGGAAPVRIGVRCAIGQYVSIHPQDHLPFQDGAGNTRNRGIEVGSNNWIGAKAILLDGCRIGDACIVAAGSVVRGIVPDRVLVAGVPAVQKKSLHASTDHR